MPTPSREERLAVLRSHMFGCYITKHETYYCPFPPQGRRTTRASSRSPSVDVATAVPRPQPHAPRHQRQVLKAKSLLGRRVPAVYRYYTKGSPSSATARPAAHRRAAPSLPTSRYCSEIRRSPAAPPVNDEDDSPLTSSSGSTSSTSIHASSSVASPSANTDDTATAAPTSKNLSVDNAAPELPRTRRRPNRFYAPFQPPPRSIAVTPRSHRITGAASAAAAGASLGGPAAAASPDVFLRLTGRDSDGVSTIGRRLLAWAEGAELVLYPAATAWSALLSYSENPLRAAEQWRRTCARSRQSMARLSNVCLFNKSTSGATASSSAADAALREQRRRSTTPGRSRRRGLRCRDVAGQKASEDGDEDAADDGPTQGSGSSLRVFRLQQEYKRWCRWQLRHFYESGASYLTQVWQHAPRSSPSSAASSLLPGVLDGRYRVPSPASILEHLQVVKSRRQRGAVLLRLLKREMERTMDEDHQKNRSRSSSFGGGEGRSGAVRHRDAQPPSADHFHEDSLHDKAVSCSGSAVNLQHDETTTAPGASASLLSNDHGTTSLSTDAALDDDPTDATEAYLDLRLDTSTGLLNISVYANGDSTGEGAEFMGSAVAGCLDNHRWVVLKGLWLDKVFFFRFHAFWDCDYAEEDFQETKVGDAGVYSAEAEAVRSRGGSAVLGLVIDGICFQRVETELHTGAPNDTFICSRCGQLRATHNTPYLSKKTMRLTRGLYYCSICCTRSLHLRVPPLVHAWQQQQGGAGAAGQYLMPVSPSPLQTMRPASAGVDSSSVCSRQSTSSRSRGAAPVGVKQVVEEWTNHGAAVHRPRWQTQTRVSSDEVFGRVRALDCPPMRPSVPAGSVGRRRGGQ